MSRWEPQLERTYEEGVLVSQKIKRTPDGEWEDYYPQPEQEIEIRFTEWLHPQMGVVPVDPETPLILKARIALPSP